MNKVVEKHLCTGCTACKSICPKNAIEMKKDQEGFFYPTIDNKKCIGCKLCERTCPILNSKKKKMKNICYAIYSKNEDVILNSSSGGIFSLLSDVILKQNGIVIGAAFNSDNKLIHTAIEKKDEIKKLRGSKYLQSEIDNIFSYIKENIDKRKILFVGTPCQVAGLKCFLKKEYDNLITIDLFCHGVPSQSLFDSYVKYVEKITDGKFKNINFRKKDNGWKNYSTYIETDKKNLLEDHWKNIYMQIFLKDISLRMSCYNCNFKINNKYSDITLGDFWGIEKIHPDLYNKDGVSAVIINSDKGCKILDEILNADLVFYKEVEIEDIIKGNPSLVKSATLNDERKTFYYELEKKGFEKVAKKYDNGRLINKIKNKIRRIMK